MPSEARQKKIVEKLNRAQKCSILGPQNLGSGGGPGPRGPPPGSAPGYRQMMHVGPCKKNCHNINALLRFLRKKFKVHRTKTGQEGTSVESQPPAC